MWLTVHQRYESYDEDNRWFGRRFIRAMVKMIFTGVVIHNDIHGVVVEDKRWIGELQENLRIE